MGECSVWLPIKTTKAGYPGYPVSWEPGKGVNSVDSTPGSKLPWSQDHSIFSIFKPRCFKRPLSVLSKRRFTLPPTNMEADRRVLEDHFPFEGTGPVRCRVNWWEVFKLVLPHQSFRSLSRRETPVLCVPFATSRWLRLGASRNMLSPEAVVKRASCCVSNFP